MKLTRPLREFIAATFSPFHVDGSLAPDVVPLQASFAAANGIRTVFITGTTGECHSLTCEEKLTLYDAWANAARTHGVAVIAHVGGNSIEDAKTLARRARDLDFAGISSLAPSYFKPATLDALIAWCAAIAAAAPELPFYYYDIPALTGVSFSIERFLIEAPPRIPNLAGVKFTNPDLVSYRRSLDVADGRFDLPWGIDEALLGGLATGAQSAVGSTYNFAPKLYVDLRAAFLGANFAEARRLQSLSIQLVEAIAATGYLGTAKALMTRLGVALGPARAPLTSPSDQQVDALIARLSELGFALAGRGEALRQK
jgi:N-acetylneuraminate lyase